MTDFSIFDSKNFEALTYEGVVYPSVENAFQVSRFDNASLRERYRYMTPHQAAYNGVRSTQTTENWIYIKYDIMYNILKTKYSDPEMRKRLLDTGNENIVITCLNHDHEWYSCRCSKCKGYGRNILGKLLMELRNELQQEDAD